MLYPRFLEISRKPEMQGVENTKYLHENSLEPNESTMERESSNKLEPKYENERPKGEIGISHGNE